MPFQIIRNDITRVTADAVVNTANPRPVIGGGTDYAIHEAAGPELLSARQEIGDIEPGQAAATPAFRLPAKYVLHTVSPVWIDGRHGEAALLRQAYDAALQLADELGCKSVAFPLMAAGTNGFPKDLALSVAVGAFTDFLLDHSMQIELVLFNAEAFGAAGSLFDDLKSYVDDRYVAARIDEEYQVDAISASLEFSEQRRKNRPRRPFRPMKESARDEDFDGAAATSGGALPSPSAPPVFSAPMAASASLEELLRQQDRTFSEYLLDLLKEREGKDSEVYKRAEVSKQLFSKILNNRDYQPTKNTAIQLALGLQLDLAQTQKLLGKAGYALTRSSKADLVVQYYIERKIYSVAFINAALDDCGLPLLKTGLKA